MSQKAKLFPTLTTLGFNKVVYNVFNDSKVVIIIKQTGFNTNPKGLKI